MTEIESVTITLRHANDGYYYPVTPEDCCLMQHCSNQDFNAVNEWGLNKLKAVAKAHNWKVKIVK